MENFNLTDEEQRTFAEWFSNLDVDKQAKLSFKNVTHFMSSYQLSDDELDKIFSICGAKRLDHFGRSQFYIALKLVSLYQNGYELSLENAMSKSNLPLPRKVSISLTSNDCEKTKHLNSIDSLSIASSFHDKHTDHHGILPPPPSSHRAKQKVSPSQLCKFCNKNLITSTGDQHLRTFVLVCPNCKHSNRNSPNNSNIICNQSNLKNQSDQTSSSDNSRCSSTELYEVYETIDTSLAFEKLKPWEKIEQQTTQDYVGGGGLDDTDESKHCLLNDEEEQVDSNKICLNINNNYDQYDSSYVKSALIDEDEDVWSMNDDQVKYYFEKFIQLLPSKQVNLLAGSNVKSFFEKSKLSLADLKQIWNLSDLDADGHLTVIEFCIAMHLVVLRRNQVPLPDQLPATLSPLIINQLLVRNQLNLIEFDRKFAMNSTLSDNHSSLQPTYHLSSGNVSTANVSNVSLITHPSVRNSFDLRNQECDNSVACVNEMINSPNREWTCFNNNSPHITTNSTARPKQECNNHLNNQPNNLSTNDVNLMTPANFTDKIELDPTLIHPLAVKVVSSAKSQQFCVDSSNSHALNKDANRVFKNPTATVLNPPLYTPRPRGHARSSSLDLTRKMINSNALHQGAFVNYRKHIQQKQTLHPGPETKNNQSDTKKDKQYFINHLKTKYQLPNLNTTAANTIDSLKDQYFWIECMHDAMIHELADALEQLSQKNA